nr:hypothetical protein [Microctonus hyperodae filamentous virus]
MLITLPSEHEIVDTIIESNFHYYSNDVNFFFLYLVAIYKHADENNFIFTNKYLYEFRRHHHQQQQTFSYNMTKDLFKQIIYLMQYYLHKNVVSFTSQLLYQLNLSMIFLREIYNYYKEHNIIVIAPLLRHDTFFLNSVVRAHEGR